MPVLPSLLPAAGGSRPWTALPPQGKV